LVMMHLVANAGRSQGLDTDQAFQKRLAYAKNRMLEQAVLDQEVTAALTEEALQGHYDQWAAAKQAEEEVQARHILLATEDDAKAVIAELESGADFATLAKERSTGPSGPEGGSLGFFGRGQMVPEFENAAFGLTTGKFSSEPVQTQFGFHVILVEDRRAIAVPALEQIAAELRNELRREIEGAYIETLRNGATVETFGLDGAPAEGVAQ